MCGCYDVVDFVCFLTFFITALVALLSVQYLVVFLDSFSTNAQGKPVFLLSSLYFWVMTLLGCMVFAGIQRRSVGLLKWPGRLLVALLISGVIFVTSYLWIVERTHPPGVHDIEGKTIKLSVMLCVVITYYFAIHKLIITIENPILHESHPTLAPDDESDHLNPPAIIQDFMKKRRKGRKSNGRIGRNNEDFSRPLNVASDGVNYYVVLLDSPYKTGGGGELHYATTTTNPMRVMMGSLKRSSERDRDRDHQSSRGRIIRSSTLLVEDDDFPFADADDIDSCSSITEV